MTERHQKSKAFSFGPKFSLPKVTPRSKMGYFEEFSSPIMEVDSPVKSKSPRKVSDFETRMFKNFAK